MATSTLMNRNARTLDPLIEGFNMGQVANSGWGGSRTFQEVWVADSARFNRLELAQNAREIGFWAYFGIPGKGGIVLCQNHPIVGYELCWVFSPYCSRSRAYSCSSVVSPSSSACSCIL